MGDVNRASLILMAVTLFKEVGTGATTDLIKMFNFILD